MKNIILIALVTFTVASCKNNKTTEPADHTPLIEKESMVTDSTQNNHEFTVDAVEHATMVLHWNGETIYVDPIGGKSAFAKFKKPDMILVTDIHEDHLSVETLTSISNFKTQIVVPKAVADKLPKELKGFITILNNGDQTKIDGFNIEAIPMYNIRKEALQFHPKGRGNGYVLEGAEKRVYISGDTEDIPEMRNLTNIDVAFVCMNLPYTMTVEKAADAVIAFRPRTVYPYHYRGKDGLSDVAKFKELVTDGDHNIKVTQLDWYPAED